MNQQEAAQKTIYDLNEQLYKAYTRIKELQDKVQELEAKYEKK